MDDQRTNRSDGGGFLNRLYWENVFASVALALSIVSAYGAFGAYQMSVGTPYYAGIPMLAAFPTITLLIAIFFFRQAKLRYDRESGKK